MKNIIYYNNIIIIYLPILKYNETEYIFFVFIICVINQSGILFGGTVMILYDIVYRLWKFKIRLAQKETKKKGPPSYKIKC